MREGAEWKVEVVIFNLPLVIVARQPEPSRDLEISDVSLRPVEAQPDVDRVRGLVAVIVYLALAVCAVLVVLGGLIGRFDPAAMFGFLAVLTGAGYAVTKHYFGRNP